MWYHHQRLRGIVMSAVCVAVCVTTALPGATEAQAQAARAPEAQVTEARARSAQAVGSVATGAIGFEPGSFLPWPPSLPDPRPVWPVPPGTPPFLPPIGPADTDWWPVPAEPLPILDDLARIVATLEQARDVLARWAGEVQRVASDTLARMIWESPGHLPRGIELPDLAGQITLLPPAWRGAIEAILAKLRAPVQPGSSDARHQTYTERSPALAREAIGIAAVDQVVTTMAVQQEAASRATSLAAAAAARDRRLPAATEAGYQVGETLAAAAERLPSTRAGVELLVAGAGAAMRQQADLGRAVADRLTIVAHQTADVSQQIATLAATTGALAARQAEHDRQALDARLGLADALSAAGGMLQQMLAGLGEPSGDEIRLIPLY